MQPEGTLLVPELGSDRVAGTPAVNYFPAAAILKT